LRSFVEDRLLVLGFDPRVPHFFWVAGQGGHGIQTSPAVSRMAAALFDGKPVPTDLAELGIDAATLSPTRPALAAVS
jgi:D-arginine dehydrogenase